MPVAATLPKAELLLFGNIYAVAGAITDYDAVSAVNGYTFNGPSFIKLLDDDGTSGIFFRDRSGNAFAQFRSDGWIHLAGYALSGETLPLTATAAGIYFKDASGAAVVAIDMSGNMSTEQPVVGTTSIALVEIPASMGNFNTRGTTHSAGPFPQMVFSSNSDDAATPILQVLNASGAVVIVIKQDGEIEVLGGVLYGLQDEDSDDVRGGYF